MRRYFYLISTAVIFSCSLVLHIAYQASGGAAWSILVSSVNGSPWELVKPFVFVYIIWFFVELSYLRPNLLHFTCSKILSLHLFIALSLILLCTVRSFWRIEYLSFGVIFFSLIISEYISYLIYHNKRRIEFFCIPIFISLGGLLTCILFFSVYPPKLPIFFDAVLEGYGYRL